MKHTIWMIGIAPTSWRYGAIRRKEGKSVFAFGPLRFARHEVSE